MPTFNRPNVTLVDTDGKGIQGVTKDGVLANGQEYPVDCIIWSTGFEVGSSWRSRYGYEIRGRNGITLGRKWGNGVKTLHGMYVPDFPNLALVNHIQGKSIQETTLCCAFILIPSLP